MKWHETEDYTKALEQILRGTDFYYMANDNITDFTDYWVEDGIHFNADFYEIWAENMITAMYDVELGLDKFDDSPEPSEEPEAA